MTDFFRFPHTPHLAWLGDGAPRGDKVLSPAEARALLDGEVIVEEKVDGANVGISLDDAGELRAQNRGTYLTRASCHPQFKLLFRWMDERKEALTEALFPDGMLFGEWAYAVHSVRYARLPDWFMGFDVFDRAERVFWSVERRDGLLRAVDAVAVPRLGAGRFDLTGLRGLLRTSRLGDAPAEGLYVRRDEAGRLGARAKLVRPEFTQAIEEHWSRRAMEINGLVSGSGWRASAVG
ncbi:MAG: RNA ligase family protein [Deltaproteobacteria bacterium]|nr:RNA ligase family protein [Deltaproteobacteria bacterium]MBK7063804.1 RNA ligase family protein [Deltaproteobacteria bacterium]MBK8691123.1 RNA ligase family protein [Deltaproteobacteria bacterium]MBP6829857.1 RNA ligase family protein [Deltaproteobacteria bacterium]